MKDKKIDWSKYTKDELILLIEIIQSVVSQYSPFALAHAIDEIERRRLYSLQQKRIQLANEALNARQEAARLMETDPNDQKTLERIRGLCEKASEADKGWERTNEAIDRLLGIEQKNRHTGERECQPGTKVLMSDTPLSLRD